MPLRFHRRNFDLRGFFLLKQVFLKDALDLRRREVNELLNLGSGHESAVLSRRGNVYAVRNVLDLMPSLASPLINRYLVEILNELVHPKWGITRLQFLDKTPAAPWVLP